MACLVVLLGVSTGCGVEGIWPFATPTSTPEPPSPTATRQPTAVAALATTSAPAPTRLPSPTPTHAPSATPTRRPTPLPTPRPSATASPTAGVAGSPTGAGPSAGHRYLVVRGKPETGVVGLSFDAGGRDGGETGSVLDTLKRFDAHATFFLTGEWSEANPGLVRRMVAEGHELGNHTYDHPDLTKVSDQEILSQAARAEEAVRKVAGVGLKRYLRPPFGAFDQRMLDVLGKQGFEVIYWTLDSGDWRAEMSVEDVARRVGTKANAGDIVVFHCYPPKTARALPSALESLKARGLKLGTVSAALGR